MISAAFAIAAILCAAYHGPTWAWAGLAALCVLAMIRESSAK